MDVSKAVSKHMAELARRANAKRGRDHYVKMAKASWASRRKVAGDKKLDKARGE